MRAYEKDIIDKIITLEGGYVNHPDDRGGETNFGVTRNTLEQVNYPTRDPKKLTLKDARDIYYHYYWKPNRYNEIENKNLAYRMLNLAVHTSGHRTSIRANKILQRAYNDLNTDQIAVDGIIGPETLGAINSYPQPRYIVKSILIQQGDLYRRLANNDPSQKQFLRGWLNRLNLGV